MREEAVCRICGEGEDDEYQLFHPCKCTGSIRHIHELCLVKWLSIKSTGRPNQEPSIYSVKGMNCELCGYNFQFAPEYSSEFVHRSKVFSLGVLFEIAKSVLFGILSQVLPFLKLVCWLLAFPLLVGMSTFSCLSLLGGKAPLHAYGESVFELDECGFRSMVVGGLGLLAGHLVLFSIRTLEARFSWRSLGGSALIGVFAGVALCSIPAFVGGVIFGFPQSSLVDLGDDLFRWSTGLGVIVSISTVGSCLSQLRSAGIRSIFTLLVAVFEKCVRLLCFVALPLAVGHLMELWVLPAASITRTLSGAGSLLFTTGLGSLLTIPVVVVQKFFVSRVISQTLRTEIEASHVVSVLLVGRKVASDVPTGSVLRDTIVRGTLHALVVGLAVLPAKWLLTMTAVLPISAPASPPASGGLLPFELLYAHVLVPLVLNVPPVPKFFTLIFRRTVRWVRSRDAGLSSRVVVALLAAVNALVLVVLLLGVGGPVMAGRLLFGEDGGVAFSVGFLSLLASMHVILRALCAWESLQAQQPLLADSSPRVDRRVASGATIATSVLSLVVVGIVSMLVLPLTVGLAFHLVVVVPLKDWVRSDEIGTPDTASSTVGLLMPVWIIGVMLLKILFATISMGRITPLLRQQLDRIRGQYETDGIWNTQVHALVYETVLIPVGKLLVRHVFVPYGVGQLLPWAVATKHLPLTYLSMLLLARVVVPWLGRHYELQKQLVFNKKYLVKTRLVNYVMDDSQFT